MQFISENDQLEYGSILNTINEESKRNTCLVKDLQQKKFEILTTKLATLLTLNNYKCSYTNVKIFKSIFEIYNLYHDKLENSDFGQFVSQENSRFCLICVRLNKELHEKLSLSKWMINISIYSRFDTVSKTIQLPEKPVPIYVVLPISNNNIFQFQVECCLYLLSNATVCLDLDKISLDILHFLEPLTDNSSLTESPVKTLKKLYYEKERNENHTSLETIYKFDCIMSKVEFLHNLLQHSFHNFDFTAFSELEKMKQLKLTVFNTSVVCIEYNLDNNVPTILIKGDCNTIALLKKALLKKGLIKINPISIQETIQNTAEQFNKMENSDSNQVLHLYGCLRRIWSKSDIDMSKTNVQDDFSLTQSL